MAFVITDPQELAEVARQAGMAVPDDINDFDLEDFVHFVIFMTVQRGEEFPYETAVLENAKMIAAIPDEVICSITIEDIIDIGFKFGPPTIALVN